MPKAPKQRRNVHERPPSRTDIREFALPSAEERLEPGTEPIAISTPVSLPVVATPKKSKELLKERLAIARERHLQESRFSKSHLRRLKRKARDALEGDNLQSVEVALEEIVKEALPNVVSEDARPGNASVVSTSKPEVKVTSALRKRALQTEQKRMISIMSHPSFKSDPFATIRQHASNTLEKRPTAMRRKKSKDHDKDVTMTS